MKTQADQHERLLRRWARRSHHRGRVFISDGIVDAQRWARAPLTVLFLLREAYGGGRPWDLRPAIREQWGQRLGKTFLNAARWAYAAHNTTAGAAPQIPTDTEEEREAAREAFLSSAVINIKKSGGTSSSDPKDIDFYIRKDGDLLRRQVDLIDPDLVVCGNVWTQLHKDLWPSAEYVFDMVWRDSERFFIDFWHPGNQFPNQINYYAFVALLQNAHIVELRNRTSPNNAL